MKLEFLKDTPTSHNPKKSYKKGIIYIMDYKLGSKYIKDEVAKRVDKIESEFKQILKKSK